MWPHLGRKIFVANWKMNGSLAFAEAYGTFLYEQRATIPQGACAIVCPPAPYLKAFCDAIQGVAFLGIQNIAAASKGAFTGEISANMAKDIGCCYGLVGHSERRHLYRESDAVVLEKMRRITEAGLAPILCVGETEEQREGGRMEEALYQQLCHVSSLGCIPGLIVAYEPVWAIGTGKTPTRANIQKACRVIHDILEAQEMHDVPFLYGGSVTAANAQDFLSLKEVQGVLVGGASVKADEFLAIIQHLDKIS
ncbi:MAG: triose-phosphate isomerase [Holosporales bacterium]|jgi:triosephosphate isomerase|nr:triose-phosphate isomerase [Holosporales bacterium]